MLVVLFRRFAGSSRAQGSLHERLRPLIFSHTEFSKLGGRESVWGDVRGWCGERERRRSRAWLRDQSQDVTLEVGVGLLCEGEAIGEKI